MDDPVQSDRSARTEFRAKLAAFAVEHPDLDTRSTATQFGTALMEESPGLINNFITSEAENILTWELRAQFSRTRSGIFAALDFANPDRPSVETLPDDKKETLYEQITQWREFVPSRNKLRLITTLTGPELDESAQFDATHIAKFGWKMLWKQKIRAGLPDDQTTVGEFYTPDQLALMGEAVRKEMTRGNFRLKIQPVRPLPRSSAIPQQTDGRHPERPEVDRGLAAS